MRCLARDLRSRRQSETIAFWVRARNCGNWRYNIYLFTLVFWHFCPIHPRLSRKRVKAWPQKEKKILFITETWTIHLAMPFYQSSLITSLVETGSLVFWSHIERWRTTTCSTWKMPVTWLFNALTKQKLKVWIEGWSVMAVCYNVFI